HVAYGRVDKPDSLHAVASLEDSFGAPPGYRQATIFGDWVKQDEPDRSANPLILKGFRNGMRRGETPRNAPIFHGWWIVLVAFICHAVNTGMIFYTWGVFFRPLPEAFVLHAPVASGFSALQFAAAGYSLLVGRAVDRHGARPVEIVGALVLAVGFLMLSRVHSLAALYLCLAGPVALGSTCIGPLPNNSAVARWFVRRR